MKADLVLAVGIPSVLSASLALSQPAPPDVKKAVPPGTKPAPAAAAPARAAGGLVVFIDPVTGKIREPDPAEIGALTAPSPKTTPAAPAVEPPLEARFGPGGAVGVVLDSRYESFLVVTKRADGTLAMECVAGGRKAGEVVSGAKPAEKQDAKEGPHVP